VRAALHAAHATLHALVQHTPSTQKPDAQVEPALHAAPIGAPVLPPPVPVALVWPPWPCVPPVPPVLPLLAVAPPCPLLAVAPP